MYVYRGSGGLSACLTSKNTDRHPIKIDTEDPQLKMSVFNLELYRSNMNAAVHTAERKQFPNLRNLNGSVIIFLYHITDH